MKSVKGKGLKDDAASQSDTVTTADLTDMTEVCYVYKLVLYS